MKLGELLKLPQFKNIKLLNRQADLSTNVTTVVTTEAPDIADFIVAGQLVVTTGYPFVNNINGLVNLIKIMKTSGAAALVIKEHRYLKKIPDRVIEVANSCFLPILLLPRDIRISTIVQDILQMILKQQNDQLSQIMEDTLNVSKYILAHCSDDEILDHISKLLKCDSFIIDIFGRLKAKNRTAQVDKNLFEYTNNQILLINLKQPITILKQYLLFPLKTTNKLTRRFVIFKLKRVTNSAQRLLIENMVNLLSLESMQVSINVIETRQRRSEIFETILSQELPEKNFTGSINVNGMNSNDEYQAFAIDEIDSIDRGANQEAMHDISNYIYWYFDKVKVPVIVIHWHFKLFGLVRSKQNLFPLLTDLNQFLRKQFSRLTEQIGFTSYFKKLSQFKKLIVEADDALLVAKRSHLKIPNQFHPHQVNDILNFIPKNEAEMFINSTLGPILKLRLADQKQLIELLEQYFAENQSISKAANKLFIHRNTAVYRLKKIEKLLKIDIRKSQDNEQLRLATKLYLIHH